MTQNLSGRTSRIDRRTVCHRGYLASQRARKRIEEAFAWIKTIAGQAKTSFRGTARVAHAGVRVAGATLDAFGRANTHLYIEVGNGSGNPGAPPPAARPLPPPPRMPTSGRSRIDLEMTLVDNRTGLVLWHARQHFHADPAKPSDVTQAMLRMLRALPRTT